MNRKARNYYFIGLILVVCFLTMDYFLNQKILKLKTQLNKSQISSSNDQMNNLKMPMVQATPENIQFQSDFKNEVSEIDQKQNDPEIVENRLQSLARQMENEDKQYLKSVVSDQKMNANDRAMAIELLARNQTPESAEILKNYASSENENSMNNLEQELVFKSQAIEGLAAYQDRNLAFSYLSEIRKKTNYKFLQDRVRRAEDSLKNEGISNE